MDFPHDPAMAAAALQLIKNGQVISDHDRYAPHHLLLLNTTLRSLRPCLQRHALNAASGVLEGSSWFSETDQPARLVDSMAESATGAPRH